MSELRTMVLFMLFIVTCWVILIAAFMYQDRQTTLQLAECMSSGGEWVRTETPPWYMECRK